MVAVLEYSGGASMMITTTFSVAVFGMIVRSCVLSMRRGMSNKRRGMMNARRGHVFIFLSFVIPYFFKSVIFKELQLGGNLGPAQRKP